MTVLKLFAGGVLLVAVAAGIFQRNSIAALRQQNAELRLTEQPASANPTPQDESAEIQSLADATKDLPRLRNEVRQLRQQKPELERLQRENGELAARISSSTNRLRLAQMDGYVAREQWSHGGFATPEATVQTFFWAVANKDVGALAECMAGDARKSMEKEIQRSIANGKQFEEQFEPFTKMQGFRIAGQKQLSDDKVELSLQAAAGGSIMPMRLQLIDGQWKLSN